MTSHSSLTGVPSNTSTDSNFFVNNGAVSDSRLDASDVRTHFAHTHSIQTKYTGVFQYLFNLIFMLGYFFKFSIQF